ncbi:MAG: acyltransferase [Bacteroidales bacterium]|nr:acyltransferase [Bacteroidales bacterium]
MVAEVFYLQSYLDHVFDHTWSLAIEEHFYIGLALVAFLFLLAKPKTMSRFVPLIITALLLLSFILRVLKSLPHKNEEFFPFFATHLRLDGILTGALIAYLYYFTNHLQKIMQYRYWLFAAAALLVSPVFVYSGGSYIMNTYGITSMNLGFGIFVVLALDKGFLAGLPNVRFIKPLYYAIGLVGVHSYSVYLWHLFVKEQVLTLQLNYRMGLTVYVMLAIVVGVLLSIIIEKPFLMLRDKYFKS